MRNSHHENKALENEATRFRALYYSFLYRILKTKELPPGDKLEAIGFTSWKDSVAFFKTLKGYKPNLNKAGIRLEAINASLSYPELVHSSNLSFVSYRKVRKLDARKVVGIEKAKFERMREVIHLVTETEISRIPAKKLHDIVRRCLNSQTNTPIVNAIREIMAARGWKCWASYDECWYERL